jgi:hypothetical protein
MYCFKPEMKDVPEGDWFCFECQNKNTIDKVCIVCGKRGKLLNCETCPKVFHPNCIDPPVSKPPKGRWSCHLCNRNKPNRKYPSKTFRKPTTPAANVSQSEEKIIKEVAQDILSTPEVSPSKEPKKKAASKSKKSKKEKEPIPVVVDKNDSSPEKVEKVEKEEKVEKPLSKKDKKAKDKDAKELAACVGVINEMESREEAWPFLNPVNTKKFPTYKKIIKTPMDIKTIKSKLEAGKYKNKAEVLVDVILIFDNCCTFNEDDSPVGQCGYTLRTFFEMRWKESVEKA